MNKITFVLIFLTTILACTPSPKRPKFIPDSKEMSELLADVYIVEATMSQSGRRINKDDDKNIGYYKGVLDEYGLTKLEFDSAISWYSSHPDLFSEVYDDVITILSKKDALLKKDMSEQNQEKKDAIDEIPNIKDLWETTRNYTLPIAENDSTNVSFPFTVKVDSIASGILRLNAGYTFIKGNELDSAYLRMWLCYSDSTTDTVQYLIKKSFKKQIGNVSQLIPEGKVLVTVEGLLFDHDTTKVSNVEIDDVKMVLLPKLGARELNQK
nr:DUF4296 domain-containing protein [uncultured Carboxylicivirga sp.]